MRKAKYCWAYITGYWFAKPCRHESSIMDISLDIYDSHNMNAT